MYRDHISKFQADAYESLLSLFQETLVGLYSIDCDEIIIIIIIIIIISEERLESR